MSKVIELKYYLGQTIVYNEHQQIANPSELITLDYDDLVFEKHIKNLAGFGVAMINCNGMYENGEKRECTDVEEALVKSYLNKPKVTLTADQQRILELEEKINKLTESVESKKQKTNIFNENAK